MFVQVYYCKHMSESPPAHLRQKAALLADSPLERIDQEETLDFVRGRTTLLARVKNDIAHLETAYQEAISPTAPALDTWTDPLPVPSLKDHQRVVATLRAVWDSIRHDEQKKVYPYKDHALFVDGSAYLETELLRERDELRRRMKEGAQPDKHTLDAYRRVRSELGALRLLRTDYPPSRDIQDGAPLSSEYFLAEDYKPVKKDHREQSITSSSNLLDLWSQLHAGTRLGIDTGKRVISMELHSAHIAGDGRMVLEGRITLGEPDMPTKQPLRVIVSKGTHPEASISLSEHEHLPRLIIKEFFLQTSRVDPLKR